MIFIHNLMAKTNAKIKRLRQKHICLVNRILISGTRTSPVENIPLTISLPAQPVCCHSAHFMGSDQQFSHSRKLQPTLRDKCLGISVYHRSTNRSLSQGHQEGQRVCLSTKQPSSSWSTLASRFIGIFQDIQGGQPWISFSFGNSISSIRGYLVVH